MTARRLPGGVVHSLPADLRSAAPTVSWKSELAPVIVIEAILSPVSTMPPPSSRNTAVPAVPVIDTSTWSPVKSVKPPTVSPPIVSVSMASAIRDSSRSIARRCGRRVPPRWDRRVDVGDRMG